MSPRLHRVLFIFSPEIAHHIAFAILRFIQPILTLFGVRKLDRSAYLHLKKCEAIYFKNRLGLAAGLDKNADSFLALSKLGFGFIEVGTVTPLPQVGNPKPRVWRVESNSLINQMGFNNCGLEKFKENIVRLKPYCKVPVLANLGKNKDTANENAISDYKILVRGLNQHVDGFVINISSPNTPGLRALQSIDFLNQLEQILETKPTLLKLAPDLPMEELSGICGFVKKSSKLTGVVLTNTSRAIAQGVYHRDSGGYSGPLLFEKAMEYVGVAREILKDDKLIIGVGGVNTLGRAQKMRQAGADLVEIYTGFIYEGPCLVKELGGKLI